MVIRLMLSDSSQTTLITLPRAKGEMPITLKVGGVFGNDDHLLYLIGRSRPLENLFLDHEDRTSRFYEKTKFYILNGKHPIFPKKTADGLKMEDGDFICQTEFFPKPPRFIL